MLEIIAKRMGDPASQERVPDLEEKLRRLSSLI